MKSPKVKENEHVLIPVCEMSETKPGVYSRSKKSFIEIAASRSDSYSCFVKRAVKKLGLRGQSGKFISIFKINGARVLDEEVTIREKTKPWRLGNYLLLMRKSPTNCKIGIGYVNVTTSSDSSSDTEDEISRESAGSQLMYKESCGNNKFIIARRKMSHVFYPVRYNIPPEQNPCKHSLPRDREYIWTSTKGKHLRDMGVYQPERDGYEVSYLTQVNADNMLVPLLYFEHHLLRPVVLKNRESKYEDICGIEWQSPGDISVNNWEKPLAIYCLPSIHPNCTYYWSKLGHPRCIYPSAPVIYVNEAGLYQCEVEYDSKKVCGNLIRVHVEIGDDDVAGRTSRKFKTISYSDESGSDTSRECINISDSDMSPVSTEAVKGKRPLEVQPAVSSTDTVPTPSVVLRPSVQVIAHSMPPWSRICDHSTVSEASNFDVVPVTSTAVSSFSSSTDPVLIPVTSTTVSSFSSATDPLLSSSKNCATVPAITFMIRVFSEEEILRATDELSPNNKIGSGGFGVVYRGWMKGTSVAVQKLTEDVAVSMAKNEGRYVPEFFTLQGQMEAEIKALSKVRHRNLVDLMGYCTKPAMLVYEFMEHGSLGDLLFHDKPKISLTWTQRGKILKDVCRGLTWLHSTLPPLVHGDVKSNNVLIDRNYTAKLGDFGFTKELPLSTSGHTMVTAAAVAKSVGYTSPEYDTCRISPKSDVYSYGIVALETFSGQEAFSKDDQLLVIVSLYYGSKICQFNLVEHLDEGRKSLDGYKAFADRNAGVVYDYMVVHYQKVIEGCLVKHSRRQSSEDVMKLWCQTNFN